MRMRIDAHRRGDKAEKKVVIHALSIVGDNRLDWLSRGHLLSRVAFTRQNPISTDWCEDYKTSNNQNLIRCGLPSTTRIEFDWGGIFASDPRLDRSARIRRPPAGSNLNDEREGQMRTVLLVAILCGVFGQVRAAHAYPCNDRHYVNSSGHDVHSPSCGRESPRHIAICRDGSISYSEHRRGTCSGHHGSPGGSEAGACGFAVRLPATRSVVRNHHGPRGANAIPAR